MQCTVPSKYGILCFQAYDPDAGENSRLRYFMDGRVQETLSENLDNVRRSPFIVDPVSGIVKLNFDPQKGMKGYFDFKVKILVNFLIFILDMKMKKSFETSHFVVK